MGETLYVFKYVQSQFNPFDKRRSFRQNKNETEATLKFVHRHVTFLGFLKLKYSFWKLYCNFLKINFIKILIKKLKKLAKTF